MKRMWFSVAVSLGLQSLVPMESTAFAQEVTKAPLPTPQRTYFLGVKVQDQDNACVVSEVLPNTQAAELGIKAGDRIKSINGRTAVPKDMPSLLADEFGETSGVGVLTIQRGEKNLWCLVFAGTAENGEKYKESPLDSDARLGFGLQATIRMTSAYLATKHLDNASAAMRGAYLREVMALECKVLDALRPYVLPDIDLYARFDFYYRIRQWYRDVALLTPSAELKRRNAEVNGERYIAHSDVLKLLRYRQSIRRGEIDKSTPVPECLANPSIDLSLPKEEQPAGTPDSSITVEDVGAAVLIAGGIWALSEVLDSGKETAAKQRPEGAIRACGDCDGDGKLESKFRNTCIRCGGTGFEFGTTRLCLVCSGSGGQMIDSSSRCPRCDGSGWLKK